MGKYSKSKSLVLFMLFSMLCSILSILPVMSVGAEEIVVRDVFTDKVEDGYAYSFPDNLHPNNTDDSKSHSGSKSYKVDFAANTGWHGFEIVQNIPIDIADIRDTASIKFYINLPEAHSFQVSIYGEDEKGEFKQSNKHKITVSSEEVDTWKEFNIPLKVFGSTFNSITKFNFQLFDVDDAGKPDIYKACVWIDTLRIVNIESSSGDEPDYTLDLSDGQAEGWILDSAYTISSNRIQNSWENFSGFRINYYDSVIWSGQYTYRVDVGNDGRNVGNRAYVIFNYQGSDKFYSVQLGGGSTNEVTLKKRNGYNPYGDDITLATYEGSYPILLSSPRTIEITYDNGSITVKGISGTEVTTLFENVVDTTYTWGKIGVASIDTVASFSNISVTRGKSPTEKAEFDIEPGSAKYVINDNIITVNANITMPVEGIGSADVIAAVYDANKRLIAVDTSFECSQSDLQDGVIPYEKTITCESSDVALVKLFVWDTKMRPYCNFAVCSEAE